MIDTSHLYKFYTNVDAAKNCYDDFKAFINGDELIIEPSAGCGNFLKVIDSDYIAFDILPEGELNIVKLDFLNENISEFINGRTTVTIGNPPYGKKSKLALEFLLKSFQYSNIVGFVLPIQFRKWSVQNKIPDDISLIYDKTLDEKSFTTNGKDYSLRTCFQIWERDSGHEDLRIKSKPETRHDDFEMWQYNNTKGALKYFEYDWDFAVHRQGYYEYSKIYKKGDEMDKKRQYIFFKAKNEEILNKLMNIDFETLSKRNTGTPGFGKADLIEYYGNY